MDRRARSSVSTHRFCFGLSRRVRRGHILCRALSTRPNHWQVCGFRGQVLDLASGTASSIVPECAAMVRERHLLAVAGGGRRGCLVLLRRFPPSALCCLPHTNDRLCVVDITWVSPTSCVRPIQAVASSAMAWRPDERPCCALGMRAAPANPDNAGSTFCPVQTTHGHGSWLVQLA